MNVSGKAFKENRSSLKMATAAAERRRPIYQLQYIELTLQARTH